LSFIVLREKIVIFGSGDKKFLRSFQNEAVFRNWVHDATKEDHKDVSDTSKFTQKAKPSENLSLMLHDFLLEPILLSE